jgi:hypothetical protein
MALGEARVMQRVRIGLTGLAFVFIVVLLAAIFIRNPAGDPPLTANLIEQQRNGMEPAEPATPRIDPLAELGVAPGNADSNSAAAAQPAPPPPNR